MRARSHHGHHAFHLARRGSSQEEDAPPGTVVGSDPPLILKPAPSAHLVPRSAAEGEKGTSTSSAASSCTPGDSSPRCEKPIGPRNTTIPIVLGVVIPLTIAIVICFILHRKYVRRMRKEDADDKHKSLDFGMDDSLGKGFDDKAGKKKAGPEMASANVHGASTADLRKGGLSLDMGSPYVLPPGLRGSRESLHSLSRTINQQDDRYRSATNFLPHDAHNSVRSYPNGSTGDLDDASSFAASTGTARDGMDQALLKNAAMTSRTTPPTHSPPALDFAGKMDHSPPRSTSRQHPTPARQDSLPAPAKAHLAPSSAGGLEPRDSYIDRDGGDMRRSNDYLGAFIGAADLPAGGRRDAASVESIPRAPSEGPPSSVGQVAVGSTETRHAEPPLSMHASVVHSPVSTDFSDDSGRGAADDLHHRSAGLPPRQSSRQPPPGPPAVPSILVPGPDPADDGLGVNTLGYDIRRLSVGLRPLPPENPSENAEQRANRIRSFYKEYFDDSKPALARPSPAYYEDYGDVYHQSGNTYHDVGAGEFVTSRAPFAQPMTRRAMTPPPRAPPRLQPGHLAQHSMGGFASPGPRSFSSASGAYGPGPASLGRPAQQRLGPPPAPLRTLPTPHLMKEGYFGVPIDFAPPPTYKDRQAGRPESPLGEMRPFSPALPVHVPLASSFDDLSLMPSPHALRKSGTFTALDFAPPPRFKSSDSGSDAGSIRSARSGGTAMSASQLHSMRAGAYRVSRLPQAVVGTKADISASLRPTWDLKTDVL